MRSQCSLSSRAARVARTHAPGQAAALTIALLAACGDESVVDPQAALVPASESSALSVSTTSDRDILIALYEATDGPNWLNSDNWLTDAPLGQWYGVDTDASGRVTTLRLAGKWDFEENHYVDHGLAGPILAELSGLARLEHLDLGVNKLSGPIPTELSRLASLRELDLGINELVGSIPTELGSLANLERLNLGRNELSGPIPTELSRLANLGSLDLEYNALSGPIPAELGGLDNLIYLQLGGNHLSGPIPAELGDLVNLSTLDLSQNGLSGPIPVQLGGLTNLGSLYLSENELSGPIPTELGGLANLRFLYLRSNDLSGTVPLSFRQLSRLTSFGFEGNAGLCLPADLVAWYEALENRDGRVCPDLEVLRALYEAAGGESWTNADGWLGDGSLGEWYGVDVDSSGFVSALDLQGNGLSGSLPTRLGELAGLTKLRVGDNALTGRLPLSLSQTPLRELYYADTQMCFAAEAWFREWLASVPQHEGTGVQCPPLTDRDILVALYETTGGPDWEDSENWLADAPLGEWSGVSTDADGRVVELDLRWNELSGPIPPALGALNELETLILFNNELTGSIPSALGDLAKAQLVVLAGNRLSGPIPARLGGLASLEELYLNGNELTSVPPELGKLSNLRELSLNFNRLTSVPPELGRLSNLRELSLNFNRLASVPRELGELVDLRYLGLWSNELTSVPPELGNLANLREMDLDENRLISVPRELARLDSLEVLWLASNELTSVPPELSELGNLWLLSLSGNRLTDLLLGPDGYANLEVLDLSSNEFAFFPRELGGLANLTQLELDGNRLTDVPPGLGAVAGARRLLASDDESPSPPRRWSESGNPWRLDINGSPLTVVSAKPNSLGTLRTHFELNWSRSADVGSRVRDFSSLEILDLSSNALSGSLPAGLVEFTGLTSLSVAGNAGLSGALPFDLTALEHLEDLHTTGTELCAPADPEFVDWLEGVTRQRVALCDRGDAAAYLTQAVQSREFPVPLVAGEPALLRVFVTAAGATNTAMPPVRATFYREGAVTHQADMPAKPGPIPPSISEGSLSKSVNVEIPGWVIQPGLEVVIEPDPEGTLDPALGVARRIPATGRMAIDVRAMPVFEMTLLPFIWEENPDSSIVEITAAMAADPEGHELFERTQLLLPVAELDVTAHPAVASPTNDGFEILGLTEMIRVAEGGSGHYLGVMAGPTGPGGLLGVANGIGSWSSFSVLDSETIAHEFGHNRNLYHAPCGGAGGPDRYYPYGRGRIGAWGYDFRTGELVPPGRPDYMSYCEPTWTSDYQFTNAFRYRLETETESIVVVAADTRGVASPSRTLLVWGGLEGDGTPYLRPAFYIDAPPKRPSSDGAWSLTGRDAGGAALFSVSFAMAEFTDTEDDHAGFSFALPVTWTGELASMTLQGPGGSVSFDRDSEDPVTILRDAATGHIRGVLDGSPEAAVPARVLGVAADAGREFEVLFSRGIPRAEDERR